MGWQRVFSAVEPGSKIVIGLGDSFTQGIGSWSEAVYRQYGGRIDPLKVPADLIESMYTNSWVSQLCRNHLPGYQPINLGVMGVGNRAAVKELYLHPQIRIHEASEAIVVYMLSGIERFDFINKYYNPNNHFVAMWPNPGDKNAPHKKLWEAYAESVWSEKFVTLEVILNILEAATYCKANGYKFIVASAFDQRISRAKFLAVLGDEHTDLVDSVPWDNFLYPQGCSSFMQLLLRYDGREEMADGKFYEFYSKLPYPTTHITNCMHPTVHGHQIMAEEIHNFLTEKFDIIR